MAHWRANLVTDHKLYESVRSPSTTNWSSNVEGAVSVGQARGPVQFEDPQSLVLSRATRTQMLVDAIQRREAVGDFPGPEGWLGDHSKSITSTTHTCSIRHSIKMPSVLARAKDLLEEEIERTLATLQQVRPIKSSGSPAREIFSLV